MNKTSKVISVDANAEVKYIDEATLQDYLEKEISAIRKCADPVARESRRLRLALLCEQHGEVRAAADLYRDVLWNVGKPDKQSELYKIARQAYRGESRLWGNKDDYTWETASQALDEAKDWFT